MLYGKFLLGRPVVKAVLARAYCQNVLHAKNGTANSMSSCVTSVYPSEGRQISFLFALPQLVVPVTCRRCIESRIPSQVERGGNNFQLHVSF
jgi:hypothetical protein